MKFEDLTDKLTAEGFYFESDEPLRVLLSIVASSHVKIPIWLLLSGASGTGKSELIGLLNEVDNTLIVSDFTDAGLRKGLLNVIDGKTLLNDDITKLLDAESTTISTLRIVFSGQFVRWEGISRDVAEAITSGKVRFQIIFGTVPAIETYREKLQELGERFITYRFKVDRKEMLNHLEDWDEEALDRCALKVKEFISGLNIDDDSFPAETVYDERLKILADWVAKARSYIPRRNFPMQGEFVDYFPEPEVGSRLFKQLKKLLIMLALIDGRVDDKYRAVPNDADFSVILKVALDSLPLNRLRVIEAISKGLHKLKMIRGYLNVQEIPFGYVIEDMELLGIIDAIGEKDNRMVSFSEEIAELLVPPKEISVIPTPKEDLSARIQDMFEDVFGDDEEELLEFLQRQRGEELVKITKESEDELAHEERYRT